MSIKWDKIMEIEKRQFEQMSEADRFIYFLLLQFGSPYAWGKENPEGSDCSGAICLALYAATGLLIRTTADGLLKQVFTKINPRAGDIRAVFYTTKKDKRDGDRYATAGTATHVAGILEDGIMLNSQEPYAKLRRISDVSNWFQKSGHEVIVRGLDRAALERMAGAGNRYGLDREFAAYFELGNGE
jgi:murein DD-endopeptidase